MFHFSRFLPATHPFLSFLLPRHTISSPKVCVAAAVSFFPAVSFPRHTLSRPKACVAAVVCFFSPFSFPRHIISCPKVCVAAVVSFFSPFSFLSRRFPFRDTPFPARKSVSLQPCPFFPVFLSAIHHFLLFLLPRHTISSPKVCVANGDGIGLGGVSGSFVAGLSPQINWLPRR